MPWFKIDDGFHCHPKVLAAGTPAVGLYVRCGSWAAQQTSEGIIPKAIARMYGTARMIKALVDAGLWHGPGHDCESCPELDANSYVIHQYLDRNPSRVEVEVARDKKSVRQQRWREGRKNVQASDGQPPSGDADVDASTRDGGDAAPIPTHPNPSPGTSYGGTSSSQPSSAPARVPSAGDEDEDRASWAALHPLTTAMSTQGMDVAWKLSAEERRRLADHASAVGVHTLIEYAARAWRSAKDTPHSARYFLEGWLALRPAAPGQSSGLRALGGGPSRTSEYLADMAAIADELRQEGSA
ncbi:hypothetical protein [Kitasatospora purpeofusca]|uniref:hypothetical protein n=1 Tax=Kitasatospora purpeofusca TaxID=67352 RepID=UPI00382668F0